MTTATQYRRRKVDDFVRFRAQARFWRAAGLGIGLVLIFVATLFAYLIPAFWSLAIVVVLAFVWLLFLEYGYIRLRCPACEAVVGDNRGFSRVVTKCRVCRAGLE